MKFKILVPIAVIFFTLTAMKGDKQAFQFFNANGKKVKFENVVKEAAKADIVFFGELHNNAMAHWFELQVTKELYKEKDGKIVLGAEMFESDNQLLLDEYLAGKIKTKNFEDESKMWNNYKTDYKPLVEFAKENQLKFIATNIPRRYASLVNKQGFEGLDSLTNEAKKLIAPLPVDYDADVKCYSDMIEMMGGMGGHVTANIPKAQAIKDATMAHFILENLGAGETFLHYNGSYHSDNFEGIVWWIKQKNPEMKIMTITTVEQDTITDLSEDALNTADFILAVPSDMTKTY
jgi:uncharacterized iron-regulated protein